MLFSIFSAMHFERYPIEIGETALRYEFMSEGINGKITKLVIYSEMAPRGVYNLAFGDKDELTGSIDDIKITNNGDSRKILITVASTLYSFTDKFPHAYIYAEGSSKARTRLYRMGIANNYEMIKEDFEVFGLRNNQWYPFEKNVDFEAFLIRRKISKFDYEKESK